MLNKQTNKRSKSIKTKSAIISLYNNTLTFQIQGSESKTLKSRLNSLIFGSSKETSLDEASRHFDNEEEGSFLFNTPEQQESSQVSTSKHTETFMKEITEIKSEISKIWETINISSNSKAHHQSLIELQQENSMLTSTITSLKRQITSTEEERDSLRLALQIMSKEIYNINSNQAHPPAISNMHPVTHSADKKLSRVIHGNQETIDVDEHCNKGNRSQTGPTKRNENSNKESKNRSYSTTTKTKPRGSVNSKNKESAGIQTENQYEVLQDLEKEAAVSENTTVIIGDSMIKQVQGWKLGRKVGLSLCLWWVWSHHFGFLSNKDMVKTWSNQSVLSH